MNSTPHILLVDDDPNLLETLGEILRVKGFDPVLAQTGALALTYTRREVFEVVLIDLKLGDMSGLDVINSIKQYTPDSECILVTGNASQASAIEAIQMGAFGYFQKPFDVDQVVLSIQRASDKYRSTLALRVSEEKYRMVADFTRDWEAWLSPDHTYLYVSPSCERITGHAAAEFFSDPELIIKIAHPEDRYMVANHYLNSASHIERDQERLFVFRIITAKGKVRWIEYSCITIHGANGQFLGWRESSRDITIRKQLENTMHVRLQLSLYSDQHTFDELLQKTLDEAEALTGSFISFLHFLEPDQKTIILQTWSTNTLKNMCTAEGKGNHYPVDQAGVWADCVNTRSPLVHNDYRNLPNRKGLPNGHAPIFRELVVPVLRNDLIVMIVGVGNKIEDYDDNDVEIVSQLANLTWDIVQRKLAEETLRESEDKYRRLVELFPDLIAIHSEGKICFANQAGLNLMGAESLEQILGRPTLDFVAPGQHGPVFERIQRALKDGVILPPLDEKFIRLDGSEVNVTVTAIPTTWKGKPAMQVIARDITETKRAEKALQTAESNYRSIFENATVGVFRSTPDGRFLNVNPAMARIYGYESVGDMIESISNISQQVYVLPADRTEFQKLIAENGMVHEFVGQNLRKDGVVIWTQTTSHIKKDERGNILYYEGFITDITARKQGEDELRLMKEALESANRDLQTALEREKELAHTDALTGINNRRQLFELAEQKLAIAVRYQQPLSVMMLDIDHFKIVNDVFGHAVGDQVLKNVAQTACAELRSTDVIGRYGGEEFVILLPMTTASRAFLLAERIRAHVEGLRIEIENGTAAVTLSIGIVELFHTNDPETVEGIFRRADQAMYAAKQAGRNRTIISPASQSAFKQG